MLNKPEGCANCPLRDKGKGFVPDKHAKRPKYMFIGEAPGKNEIEQGEPFVGKAGFVLMNWLIRAVPTFQIAKERGEITFANTLRCLPPEVQGRPYPKGQERLDAESFCRQYNKIDEATQTIVLFGESPQRAWFGPELELEDATDRSLRRDLKGVMGRIGRVYEKDGKRWVFAPHPAYILRQPAIVEHGQEALKIAANTEKVVEPDYRKWDESIKELTNV